MPGNGERLRLIIVKETRASLYNSFVVGCRYMGGGGSGKPARTLTLSPAK